MSLAVSLYRIRSVAAGPPPPLEPPPARCGKRPRQHSQRSTCVRFRSSSARLLPVCCLLFILRLVQQSMLRLFRATVQERCHAQQSQSRTSFTSASKNVSRNVCTARRSEVLS